MNECDVLIKLMAIDTVAGSNGRGGVVLLSELPTALLLTLSNDGCLFPSHPLANGEIFKTL